MPEWLKSALKTIAWFIALFITACFIFDAFVQFRMSDDELLQFFADNHVKGEVRYFYSHGRNIRYISAGEDSLPALLFIHGSPNSLSIYKDYYKDSLFLHNFKMYAIDRPGYGGSGLGKPMPSIQEQAAIVADMLNTFNHVRHPLIIVAGSYGTSVACRIAMDYPQLVNGLVLTGPSLAPGRETVYWFSKAVENPLINWFIPRMFKSANTEKLAHGKELTKMLPYWKSIRIPVMYMQGEKDELIDTSNAGFAKQQLVNAPYLTIHFFKGRPHFIPLVERPYIRSKILAMHQLLQ